MLVGGPPDRRRGISRRLRRAVWAASTLLALVLIGALVTWRIRKENAPEEYLPGETSKDITSALSDRATRTPATTVPAITNKVSARVVDPLLDSGRKLPQGAPEPRFTDVTKAAGLASFRQFQGPRTSQLPEDMGSGVAWGDFDNDGLDDLFVVRSSVSLDLPKSTLAPSGLY
jgi:hypothetical protein